MNLDDHCNFNLIDKEDMYREIDHLPDQLLTGWELASTVEFRNLNSYAAIIMAGMGGSAIGADLVSAYVENQIKIPVIIHRNYGLPDWAMGKRYCVITSSHSGNTEETLSSFTEAIKRDCSVIAISTGGELANHANEKGIPVVQFSHKGQPRSAVGFSFGILLQLFYKLNLIPNLHQELQKCVSFIKEKQINLIISSPLCNNPAKRLAGQLVGRFISIFASDFITPVARRWKGQFNELAKVWCQFDTIPEANHNTLTGILEPSEKLNSQFALFINSNFNSIGNQKRTKLMGKELLINGIAVDTFIPEGESSLEQMWHAILFGDYLAYYLALLYGQDPTPIKPITEFKSKLDKLID